MRRLETPWGAKVSPAGFGCAGLGSRVDARTGLRLLEHAVVNGVNWIDVAPGYGDGDAESIVGRLPAAVKRELHITTKIGLAARPSRLRRMLAPLGRPVVAALPGLRPLLRGSAGVMAVALDARTVRRSVEDSLRRLGVEQVGALLLHGPAADRIGHDETARVLETLVASGKVRSIGIAPDAVQPVEAHEADIVQLPATLFAPAPLGTRFAVRHGALRALPRLKRLLRKSAEAKNLARDHASDPAAFLTDYALATNAFGVCLFSTMSMPHLDRLLARLDRDIDPAILGVGAALARLAHERGL
jgi:aryl-alcohol dehydrogenase-like predicted oxidoreductase